MIIAIIIGIVIVGTGMDLITRRKNEQKAAAKRINNTMGDRSDGGHSST